MVEKNGESTSRFVHFTRHGWCQVLKITRYKSQGFGLLGLLLNRSIQKRGRNGSPEAQEGRKPHVRWELAQNRVRKLNTHDH